MTLLYLAISDKMKSAVSDIDYCNRLSILVSHNNVKLELGHIHTPAVNMCILCTCVQWHGVCSVYRHLEYICTTF